MSTVQELPFFPGGTAVTRLAVYDWAAEDGVCGGSPHLHTASTEAYLVIGGTGQVETLSSDGYAAHDLTAGNLLWFSPGTVHRLINGGDLDLLVVMQNAGLPEAGDAVLTFVPEVLADPERYRRLATLPSPDAGEDVLAAAALARRDAALAGYAELRADVERRGYAALAEFHKAAVNVVRDRVPEWRKLWAEKVLAEAQSTDAWLSDLERGEGSHLAKASVARANPRSAERLFGMCGRLQTWAPGMPA
ncbi:cupin domain-containing protein [Arthrobacter rhizosphaerae]|uniref:cupin domain-containing protein n=1 Tax=Arthrobacter rhizosphaerae TaxID=2855490 RepID=UPI001FF0F938|nr:cupin domain-containing protein [Arthrobacter rhizosphaerae]